MSDTPSRCETGARGPSDPVPPAAGSRVLRFRPGFRWEGVPVEAYKAPADHWCGISRALLAGGRGEQTAFQVRYFEIAPGGFSSREHHAHDMLVGVVLP